MEAWAQELLGAYKIKLTPLAVEITDAIKRDPTTKITYNVADIEQFLMAVYAMMEEQLDGRESEAFNTYIGAVVPSQIAQGENLLAMIRHATRNAVLYYKELIPGIPAEHQKAAGDFLMDWWANLNMEVARSGLEAGWKL